ncbi:GOLPH3/VPS74 family protein [Kribbella deserti]|uniref:GPP34 family phosphoprotein n=1 Tax=Kribbella deserti TaxID=1926257 RepID=A0ABV6QYH8_9ACTN
MLIAEDLLLLLHDDTSGEAAAGSLSLDYALAGAVLIELTLLGRLRVVAHETGDRLVVIDDSPTGDAVLDTRLALLTGKPVKGKNGVRPVRMVPKLAKDLRAELLNRLECKGIAHIDRENVLSLSPVSRWPARDASHELEVRAGLESALKLGNTPNDRTGVLITLLHAQHVVPKVITGPMGRKALRRRAEQIATAASSTREAVDAIQTGVSAALSQTAPTPA